MDDLLVVILDNLHGELYFPEQVLEEMFAFDDLSFARLLLPLQVYIILFLCDLSSEGVIVLIHPLQLGLDSSKCVVLIYSRL